MLKRLSEFKGDEALDVLCQIIDPIDEIISDEEIMTTIVKTGSKLTVAKLLLTKHREAAKAIICALGDYESVNALTLPFEAIRVINDPEIVGLFTSLTPGAVNPPSGDVSAKQGE